MNPSLLNDLPLWSAPFGIRLLDSIEYRRHITALDIGFGTGFPMIEIAMRLGEGSTVYGIDPSREMVEFVTSKLHDLRLQTSECEHQITDCRLIHGVAEAIPLGDASIDLITSNNGINNAGDIPAVIAECARVIRPGGQFVQAMNTAGTMNEFYLHFHAVLAERGMTAEIEKIRRHVALKRPPVDWIVSLLQKEGFTVGQVIHDQFNYRFADGTALFGHPFIRMAFMSVWREMVPGERREEVFGTIEARLNEEAKKGGGLRLSVPFVVIHSRK